MYGAAKLQIKSTSIALGDQEHETSVQRALGRCGIVVIKEYDF